METSAKASINVEEAFFTLARDIKCKMEKRLVRPNTSFLNVKYLCQLLLLYLSLTSFPLSTKKYEQQVNIGMLIVLIMIIVVVLNNF
jgi:hypothetical protein